MRILMSFLLSILACAASARDLHLCVDINDWAPYTYPDRDGILQQRVREAAARAGDSVTYLAVPWLRCQSMVEGGAMDGVLALPGLATKSEHFAFPIANGEIDATRAAGMGELVLLRRADSEVSWDGRHLTGLQGKVAYVLGYDGIAALLEELGIPNSGEYHSDSQDMMALLAGRTNVIATYAQNAKALMEMPAYQGKLVLLQPPLGHMHYFVAFNKAFYAEERDRVEALWTGLSARHDPD